jgi:hypothetical protein
MLDRVKNKHSGYAEPNHDVTEFRIHFLNAHVSCYGRDMGVYGALHGRVRVGGLHARRTFCRSGRICQLRFEQTESGVSE